MALIWESPGGQANPQEERRLSNVFAGDSILFQSGFQWDVGTGASIREKVVAQSNLIGLAKKLANSLIEFCTSLKSTISEGV